MNTPKAGDKQNGARAPQSLHMRILNDVRSKIMSGEWPPGHRIPFETEMAKHYGCSRMTVNKALTQLTQSGLLDRNRKSGTFVRAPSSLSAALEITNISTEVERAAKRYSYRLLADVIRDAAGDELELLGLTNARRIRRLACLHLADGTPFCHEERLINIDAVPEIEDVAFTQTAPGAWLLRTVPWNSAEHEISASSASPALAEALQITPGNACLVVQRKTQNDKGQVTWARLTYPGSQHALFARFTPSEIV